MAVMLAIALCNPEEEQARQFSQRVKSPAVQETHGKKFKHLKVCCIFATMKIFAQCTLGTILTMPPGAGAVETRRS